MASKPLELHPQAEEEYLTALAWYAARSPAAAVNFEKAFERAIKKVQQAPTRWPIYFESCRRYTLHQFPFAIVYRVLSSQILVLAVAHGHRRPGYWRGRLQRRTAGWSSLPRLSREDEIIRPAASVSCPF